MLRNYSKSCFWKFIFWGVGGIFLTIQPASAQDDFLTMCGGGTGALPSVWQRNGANISFSNGRVGIGTNNPNYALDVSGTVNALSYLLNGQPLTANFQTRITDACPAGQYMYGVTEAGGVQCRTDAMGGGGGGGTITGVTAGSGLTGGGSSGNVSLAVANGGITSSHIADGTITGNDIANGTITAAKLAPGTVTSSFLLCPLSGGTGGCTEAQADEGKGTANYRAINCHATAGAPGLAMMVLHYGTRAGGSAAWEYWNGPNTGTPWLKCAGTVLVAKIN